MKKRIVRKICTFSICVILLLFVFIALPFRAISGGKSSCAWSYTVEKGIEKSVRYYLLVYSHDSETPVEKKIEVRSRCQKPYRTEGAYGVCTHDLHVRPRNKTFSLRTGEDVVMISSNPLLLGTIEYGCCAEADIVRFYTENGQYLGTLKGLDLLDRQWNIKNRITAKFNFGNKTKYKNTTHLVLETDDKPNAFRVLVFDKDARPRSIPISVDNALIANCREWFLSDYVKYAGKDDLTMKLHGRLCKDHGDDQDPVFNCSVSENAVACSLKKSGN